MLAGLLLFSGCGPSADTSKGVKVKGKLVSGGSALESMPEFVPGKPNVRVNVNFHPEDPKGKGSSGTCKADGSFELQDGIAPGKYKVTVTHFDQGLKIGPKGTSGTATKPGTKPTGGAQETNDRLKGKFNIENTKITVTVPDGKTEYDLGTIDLEDEKTWTAK
jgi:hypothetical protein